jgi:pimeloyl-ACP methyl ester carboxylesterase
MNPDGFKKPLTMAAYASRGVGEAVLAAMGPWGFKQAMYKIGVTDATICPPEELVGHLHLLKKGDDGRGDKGRAFLKIMRGFEADAEKQALYHGALNAASYPKMAIWGELDPALSVHTEGETARALVGDANFHRLPALHFLQETHAPRIAELIAEFVSR